MGLFSSLLVLTVLRDACCCCVAGRLLDRRCPALGGAVAPAVAVPLLALALTWSAS